jgi:hypothetical protein
MASPLFNGMKAMIKLPNPMASMLMNAFIILRCVKCMYLHIMSGRINVKIQNNQSID